MKENSDFSNNKNKIENEVFKQLKINSNNISASRSDKIKPLPLPILSNLNKFLNNYVKKEEYWVSLKDYLKRIYYFNEEDFYLGYKNILYCFKPLNLIEIKKDVELKSSIREILKKLKKNSPSSKKYYNF